MKGFEREYLDIAKDHVNQRKASFAFVTDIFNVLLLLASCFSIIFVQKHTYIEIISLLLVGYI
jgi:hypothetical protein